MVKAFRTNVGASRSPHNTARMAATNAPLPGTMIEGRVMKRSDPSRKLIAKVTAAARGMLPLPYASPAMPSGPFEPASSSRTSDSSTAWISGR